MTLRYVSILLALFITACTGTDRDAAAPTGPTVSAADNLSATTLTTQDYRQYLSARGYSELHHMVDKSNIQQEIALDYHSNHVLAEHARAIGVDQDPLVRERIARANRQILITALVDKLKAEMEYPEEKVLDELAFEYYQHNLHLFTHEEARRVAHILLKDQYDCPCEVKSLGERIDDIYAELENGTDFAILAAKYSADRANAENGGELSKPALEEGPYVPKFTSAAFDLINVGDVSNPVRTRFGTHLIKLLEIIPGQTLPYEEVRESLIESKRKELFDSKIEKLRSDAYPTLDSLDLDAMNQIIKDLVKQAKPESFIESKRTPAPTAAASEATPSPTESTDSTDEHHDQ